jgi:hypothetical protein
VTCSHIPLLGYTNECTAAFPGKEVVITGIEVKPRLGVLVRRWGVGVGNLEPCCLRVSWFVVREAHHLEVG